eukprot:m.687397 g.687397  ORF g.687397 m.687397 type:complete len:100 (-) comp58627_c0_seq24:578-877(-)
MIDMVVKLSLEAHRLDQRTLFVVGTYTIGKERVFEAIADALNLDKVFVEAHKRRILNCFNDEVVKCRLSTDAKLSMLHVLPLGKVNHKVRIPMVGHVFL